MQVPNTEGNNVNDTHIMNNITLSPSEEEAKNSRPLKKTTKTFSSAANVVLSSVKMKQAAESHNKRENSMKQLEAEQSFLSTCGDTYNSTVGYIIHNIKWTLITS